MIREVTLKVQPCCTLLVEYDYPKVALDHLGSSRLPYIFDLSKPPIVTLPFYFPRSTETIALSTRPKRETYSTIDMNLL